MKSDRQHRILELIGTNRIETQEELLHLLHADGYAVTQATVSRDIRELALVKRADHGGRQYYTVPQKDVQERVSAYDTIFREGFVSVDTAQNILVVKTVSGMAMAVAAALDAMQETAIVGTIAGDDTVMCAVRTAEEAAQLRDRLYRYATETI